MRSAQFSLRSVHMFLYYRDGGSGSSRREERGEIKERSVKTAGVFRRKVTFVLFSPSLNSTHKSLVTHQQDQVFQGHGIELHMVYISHTHPTPTAHPPPPM